MRTLLSNFRASFYRPGYPSFEIRDVSYPADNTAYVVLGRDPTATTPGAGMILRSNNGVDAKKWDKVFDSPQPLKGVDCFDATNCVAVGDNGTILRTADGATWKEEWATDTDIVKAKDTSTAVTTFWKVAYINTSKIIVVGTKSVGTGVTGVIYTLGTKEGITGRGGGGRQKQLNAVMGVQQCGVMQTQRQLTLHSILCWEGLILCV